MAKDKLLIKTPSGKWWDVGLQLVEGCTPVSPACDHCWALAAAYMRRYNPNPKVAARYEGTVKYFNPSVESTVYAPKWTGQVNLQWQDLDKIGRARTPKAYTFWTDLFHPDISFDLGMLQPAESFIDEVLVKILTRPRHFYIICTKRPERALEYFLSRQEDIANWAGARDILAHRLMLMTTVETQEWADRRIPLLLQIPGVLHGVSYEPALGQVDFLPWLPYKWRCSKCGYRTNDFVGNCKGYCQDSTGNSCDAMPCPQCGKYHYWTGSMSGLDWLICGAESGPHARPMHSDWPRQARDQAVAAGVPFFFKSWGEFIQCAEPQEVWNKGNGDFDTLPAHQCFKRVGRKAAGRLLDDREWNEVPHDLQYLLKEE